MGSQKLFDLISCRDQEGNISSTDPNSFGINFDFDKAVQGRPGTVYQTSFDSRFSLEQRMRYVRRNQSNYLAVRISAPDVSII